MKRFTLYGLLLAMGIGIGMAFSSEELPLSRADVQSAASIIGMEFTEGEIDSMLPSLGETRSSYQRMRERALDNATGPALVFNPLPVGFQPSNTQSTIGYDIPRNIKLPIDRQALAFYTVGQLATLIRSRQISSTELTRFFIDRLKKYDDTLHCVVTLMEEQAIRQAQVVDAELEKGLYRGPLHGIPYGAKDLLATRNAKTTWGATPYADQHLPDDATVIRKLEEAGAVLVAKLSLGALAWGDVWFGGQTRNPWDPSRGSSGSSAGSASAVAAGLLPFAIGSETLGSIVSPSTVCGTTGLRPTFGRVSRYGAMALSWSMDKIGPICRSVDDCAIVFEAIRGVDPRDPSTIAADFNYRATQSVDEWRIGYVRSAFESDHLFRVQDSMTLVKLRALGVELIPIELPERPEYGFILTAEAAAAFDDLTRSNRDDLLVRQIRNAWPNVFRQSRFVPAVEYIQANRHRTKLIADMDDIMKEIDVYVTPSWGGPNLFVTNLTGHPQVVLPNGFEDGRPTSVSFVGRLFDEARLLRFAKFYQDATSFHRKHPPYFQGR